MEICDRESFFYPVKAATFFSNYTNHIDSSETPTTVLLRGISKYFTRFVNVPSEDLLIHLKNIYEHFHLDNEILLLSVIILVRYMRAASQVLNISRDSELFYLFILCIIITFKALLDLPIDSGAIARSLNLDSSRIFHNEMQIMLALNFTLFFTRDDVISLDEVFPVEGLMLLSYASTPISESYLPPIGSDLSFECVCTNQKPEHLTPPSFFVQKSQNVFSNTSSVSPKTLITTPEINTSYVNSYSSMYKPSY